MDDRQTELVLEKLDDIIRLLGLLLTDHEAKAVKIAVGDDPNAAPAKEEGCSHQNVTVSSAPQGSVTRCDDCNEVVGLSKNRKK